MAAPKLRFKEFDADWISNKIIDLADYVDYRGKTPKKVESGILLVTAKNIKQGYLDYSVSQEFIEPSDFDEVMRRGKVELNDVLITTEAPLGNVASVDRTDIALAQRVIKYRGKIDLLDNLFLKQKFLSESFQEILKSKATGGTVQGIKGSVLHQIPLIVPSKEEQTKIATFLSAVDEKISQLSQKLHLLGQYKQGMMQKLFSQQIRFKADDGSEFGEWQENQLLDLSTKKSSKVTAKDIEDNDGDYIVFGASGHFRNINSYTESEPYIAIVKDGAGAGRLFLMPEKSSVLGTLEIVKPNLNIQLNFLFYRMQLIDFSSYIKGSTIPHVYFKDYSQEKIYLPCLEEQTKIANFLSAIDQKIEVVAQQIEQAKTWKKGLLQQMFI